MQFVVLKLLLCLAIASCQQTDGDEMVHKCFSLLNAISSKERPSVSTDIDIIEVVDDSYVLFSNAISDDEVINLNNLAHCVKEFDPTYFLHRRFGKDYGFGGNNCTYVGGFVNENLPSFVNRAQTIADKLVGQFSNPDNLMPSSLGIRGMEHLQYDEGSELNFHTDSDSVYTLILLIAENEDFTGGNFKIIDTEKTLHTVSLNYRGGILFNSNLDHGIEKVISGKRKVFCIEFWEYPNAPKLNYRPPPDDEKIQANPQ